MNRRQNDQKRDQANQLVSRVLRPHWANRKSADHALCNSSALFVYGGPTGEEHCYESFCRDCGNNFSFRDGSIFRRARHVVE